MGGVGRCQLFPKKVVSHNVTNFVLIWRRGLSLRWGGVGVEVSMFNEC